MGSARTSAKILARKNILKIKEIYQFQAP